MKALILRRQGQAENTAGKLRALGHEPVLLPIFRLQPIAGGMRELVEKGPWQGIVLTSAAALEALADPVSLLRAGTPVFAVGSATAEAARSAGFPEVHSADGDAKDLARLLRERFEGADARLVHPCGKASGFEIEEGGPAIDSIAIYRIEPNDPGRDALGRALKEAAGGVQMHYSPASAQAFFALVERHGLQALSRAMCAAAISPNTAAAIPAELVSGVRIAKMPSESAMLDVVQSLD